MERPLQEESLTPLPPPPTPSDASPPCRDWVESVERVAALQQERLEVELNSFKTNLVKESIRLGHSDLGAFFLQRGDLAVRRGLQGGVGGGGMELMRWQ